jgi:hypothetical protein
MVRPVKIPIGAWPTEMPADLAAGYVGEPSVDAFLSKVQRKVYPDPAREAGCLPKWHRAKLDAAIARRHGLDISSGETVEDATALI